MMTFRGVAATDTDAEIEIFRPAPVSGMVYTTRAATVPGKLHWAEQLRVIAVV